MKKLKKIIVSVLAATLLMSVSAFAATGTDAATIAEVTKQLAAAGVQQVYVDQVSTYLVDHVITQADKDNLVATAKELKEQVGERRSADQFTSTEISQITKDVNASLAPIGLKVLADTGTLELSIQNLATKTEITSISLDEAMEQKENIDGTKAQAALDVAIKGYVAPIVPVTPGTTPATPAATTPAATTPATAMKKTGTNNGNVLALGLGVLALAGAAFAVSKKVTA